MDKITIFGFEKGMKIEQINSVSTKDAVLENKHKKNLLEVFPKKIEIEGFDKYNIKINKDSIIEQLILHANGIESKVLPEKSEKFFQIMSNKFGNFDSEESDNISYFNSESDELLKAINDNKKLNYIWKKNIKTEYKKIIKQITMTIKLNNNDTGFVYVEFLFNDSNEEMSSYSTPELDKDLLENDNETVYENDSLYEENVAPTDNNSQQYEKIEENAEKCIEPIVSDNGKDVSKEEAAEENQISSIFKMSKINLIWCILMLGVWIFFLYEPIKQNFMNKQKGSWINFLYYILYFAYTLLACCLPFILKSFLNIFIRTEKKERKALTTGENFNTKEHGIWSAYKSTFFDKNFGITNKTRASADLYFNYESVANTMIPNFPVANIFKLISGSFMGLGILGTFIGFAIGLRNINFSSTNTKVMLNGIESLVKNGLATAFNTSIVGVFCSLIYNFLIYNPLLLKFNKYFEQLSDSLDKDFYVSETEALMQYTMLTDENAQNITFSQSLRFIVENMNKQTDALNNFNDSLADKIANMNETVNSTLGNIVTGLGGEVKAAVLENVHLEMDGLKLSLTDAAKQLGLVAEKISNTPELLSKANEELKTYLEDTRSSFSEMLNQNLESNKTVLNEVVNTIQTELTSKFSKFSSSITKALSSSQKAAELLDNIPDKIVQIEESFTSQEKDVAEKFETAASKLEDVSTNVNDYLESVEDGITVILKDLSSAEENVKDLLASAKINEDNSGKNLTAVIEETNRMLEGFKSVDINLKNIFESIGNEIVKYNTTVDSTLKQYLSSFEDGSKSFSSSIHGSIQEFEDTINELSSNIEEVQLTSKSFDVSITKLAELLSQKKQNKKQENK